MTFQTKIMEILTNLHTIPCKINREEALSEILEAVKEVLGNEPVPHYLDDKSGVDRTLGAKAYREWVIEKLEEKA